MDAIEMSGGRTEVASKTLGEFGHVDKFKT